MRSKAYNFQIIIIPLLVIMLTLIINVFAGRKEYFYLLCLVILAITAIRLFSAKHKSKTQNTLWQFQPGISRDAKDELANLTEEMEFNSNNQPKSKSIRAGLSEQKKNEIISKIVVLMERDKLYQETELTLQDLAGKIQAPTYQVSQALNEGMKKNFYDLVNGYRVEEAKNLLLDPKSINYTILSVGFEAGFNSKTTFNTVFKKFTGLTPTDFRQKQKQLVLAA